MLSIICVSLSCLFHSSSTEWLPLLLRHMGRCPHNININYYRLPDVLVQMQLSGGRGSGWASLGQWVKGLLPVQSTVVGQWDHSVWMRLQGPVLLLVLRKEARQNFHNTFV